MTALLIIAGILLLLAVLINCPVIIWVEFHDELHLKLGYLFFRYTLVPQPEPKKEAPKEPEAAGEEQPKESRFRRILKEQGLSGFLDIIREISRIASEAARELFSHLIFDRFHLEISVAGSDAAQTALNYGYVCGAVGSTAGWILGNVRNNHYHISVNPDFQGEKSQVIFEAKARIRLISFLYGGLRALIRVLKVIKSLKTINNKAS